MLADMHTLDLTTQAEWCAVQPVGVAPCARSGAAAAALERRFFVFGGWDERKRELNDLWEFHTGTSLWSQLAARDGVVPSPRTSAALVAQAGRLLLFGGCDARGPFGELFQYRLDESSGSAAAGWAVLDTAGPSHAPARRSNHVAVCFEERTFVFGGFDGSHFLADLHAVGPAARN